MALALAAQERIDSKPIDRVVALLERDVELAAEIREMLGIEGQPRWQAHLFRDKLAMRLHALSCGVKVPYFAAAADRDAVTRMLEQVPPPYLLKPRDGLGASGIKRLDRREEVFQALDALGDKVDRYLLEQYVAGAVYHVDAVTKDGTPRFAVASRYGLPLLDVLQGGNFVSYTIARGSALEQRLLEANRRIIQGFGYQRGVSHIEFIVGRDDQEIYFLEGASRMAAARIPWVLKQATGVCMYEEWAGLEALPDYEPAHAREGYAGIITTVTKRGPANLGHFQDPSIVWKSSDPYVPSMIVRADDPRSLEDRMRYLDREFASL
ncbi:argininosuccinate lyase [compost metagenome]